MLVEPSNENFQQEVWHIRLELRVKIRIPLPSQNRYSAQELCATEQAAVGVLSVVTGWAYVVNIPTHWKHELCELTYNHMLNDMDLKIL